MFVPLGPTVRGRLLLSNNDTGSSLIGGTREATTFQTERELTHGTMTNWTVSTELVYVFKTYVTNYPAYYNTHTSSKRQHIIVLTSEPRSHTLF